MGKIAVIKTQETVAGVEDYINGIADEQQRKDSFLLVALMEHATGEKPKMWGNAIIGFGNIRYKSEKTGRAVDWFNVGFSPRKAKISLHLTGT